jgi:drug/metabolite transporter (DMT)-like permease
MGALSTFMGIMLISGTCNTLLMKFMVMQRVPTGPGGPKEGFDHPYFQSLLMMIGEFLCLIAYFLTRDTKAADMEEGSQARPNGAPKYIFMIACLLDWTATTMVNMAYGVIAASVVQMTRGAIVIFTCLFSVVFLGRRQYRYHIAGVALVFLGITLVSLSTFINPAHSGAAPQQRVSAKLFGIGLCVSAQVFQASMLVYEEKIMSQYYVEPLQVVGMEGFFGIIFGVLLLTTLNFTGVESTPEALYQMNHSVPLAIAVVGSIFSIAFFNFSGVTVTQQASAVARSTIDVSRTILIWAVELAVGWNSFNALQLAGFVVLAMGTLLYNRLVVISHLEPPAEAEPVLPAGHHAKPGSPKAGGA